MLDAVKVLIGYRDHNNRNVNDNLYIQVAFYIYSPTDYLWISEYGTIMCGKVTCCVPRSVLLRNCQKIVNYASWCKTSVNVLFWIAKPDIRLLQFQYNNDKYVRNLYMPYESLIYQFDKLFHYHK